MFQSPKFDCPILTDHHFILCQHILMKFSANCHNISFYWPAKLYSIIFEIDLFIATVYIRHFQESNSQPVPSQAGADTIRPQWLSNSKVTDFKISLSQFNKLCKAVGLSRFEQDSDVYERIDILEIQKGNHQRSQLNNTTSSNQFPVSRPGNEAGRNYQGGWACTTIFESLHIY